MNMARPWAPRAYVAVALAFAAGVALQVFFAGAAIVHDAGFWGWHVAFAPFLELVALGLVLIGIIGRLPARFVVLPLVLIGLVMFQYASMSFRPSLIAALHPVNALVLFVTPLWAAASLRPRPGAWRLVGRGGHTRG